MKVPAHRTSKHRSGIGRQTGLCVTRLLMGTMRQKETFVFRRSEYDLKPKLDFWSPRRRGQAGKNPPGEGMCSFIVVLS
jgi:hypothetical protein